MATSVEVVSEIQSATPDAVTNVLTVEKLNDGLRKQGMSESTGMHTNIRYSTPFVCLRVSVCACFESSTIKTLVQYSLCICVSVSISFSLRHDFAVVSQAVTHNNMLLTLY